MIVGIDLGTSNSGVAVWSDGSAQLIPNSLGEVLTPSAVSVDKRGVVHVGRAARDRLITHPKDTAISFKRYMGTSRLTRLGGRDYLPEELSALVLASLKSDAEIHLGAPVSEAVITVPAYFNDRQRKATRRAGQLAGLRVERLLNEPTAAALAYGLHRLDAESRFLVFDLGGGTFDVSVLEIFEGVMEVRATAGDNRLGGDDFTEALVDVVFESQGAKWKVWGKEQELKLYQLVRDQCDRARRALGKAPTATVEVPWKGEVYRRTFSADEFEELSSPLLTRLRDPVLQALRDSNVQSSGIREIVLVGGATRMPVVRQTVTKMFGRFPTAQINPDEVVALGAAVQAGLKMRHEDLKEVVLTDVCPYSLGVDSAERSGDGQIRPGIFSPIIERNTVIPASRRRCFSPVHDGQKAVEFGVYQGESRYVADNIRLGSIKIPLPPGRAEDIAVECRFTYDIDGLLDIDVVVPKTGEKRQLTISSGEFMLDADTLAERRAQLARLKIHPRDQAENSAALERARRCYEQFLGDKRELVGQALNQFQTVLDRQDPREIAAAVQQLHKYLDQIEGERFL